MAEFKDVSHERHDGAAIGRPDKYEYVEHEKPWRYQEGEYTGAHGLAPAAISAVGFCSTPTRTATS